MNNSLTLCHASLTPQVDKHTNALQVWLINVGVATCIPYKEC